MKSSKHSVIVIGSGIAGLISAIKLAENPNLKILLVTKSPLGESNTRYAQGGIAAVISSNKNDSIILHSSDTLSSGSGLCDQNTVEKISAKSENIINFLISNGVDFDKNSEGKFEYALGGAHSVKRILHSNGDSTGMTIINALVQKVKNLPNIQILDKTLAVELLISEDKKCKGLILFNKISNEYQAAYSDAVIIASGGAGQVYKYTTNPYGATGDGIALAYNAGIEIQDMEFIQFHPTAFIPSTKTRTRYLISEAVRGEGAKLINSEGEEFMKKYSELKELAQRDVVTRAIFSEMQKENKSNVFLDITAIEKSKFPAIEKKCRANGFDISKTPIPVAPAAHYTIGGIKTNLDGKTSIDDLYTIGEAASTGFHGANRLASNSLLECAVCAYECAKNLKFCSELKQNDKKITAAIEKYTADIDFKEVNTDLIKDKLRTIMWEKVGIFRNEENLKQAEKEIEVLKKEFNREKKCKNYEEYELRNMLISALLITKSALQRKESRGAHFRTDYPQANENPEHTILTNP